MSNQSNSGSASQTTSAPKKTATKKKTAKKKTTPKKTSTKRASAKATATQSVDVVMRRDCLGQEKDQVIATVQLAEGVSLNFLVDAVRNDIAGERRE